MIFHIISSTGNFPYEGQNAVYLKADNWNDYSFITGFKVMCFDENGSRFKLGSVKIGFVGQTTNISTSDTLGTGFERLPAGYFSLGVDVKYYSSISQNASTEWRNEFLTCLRDVVNDPEILEQAQSEEVFKDSHLRGVSISSIRDQFTRVLNGFAVTTDFEFRFSLPASDTNAGFDLEFVVAADSKPSSNIHALIGRNGVGKTTILSKMAKAIAQDAEAGANFTRPSSLLDERPLGKGYFSSVVSVAFSAFDPFDVPSEQRSEDTETPHTYIGLKSYSDADGARLKREYELRDELVESLKFCLNDELRRERWLRAVETLESDINFAEWALPELCDCAEDELEEEIRSRLDKMSSGHTIVFLTITQLVERVQEKTLVLFDEPEGHLHPPLLSALIRSLSQLLHNRNAIAIIATHSPVVLQEIPKSCVWKVVRERLSGNQARPETETFGENVGTLTREVFHLEVTQSGFHTLLAEAVLRGLTYDEVIVEFNGRLGFEAKSLLRAMVSQRDELRGQP